MGVANVAAAGAVPSFRSLQPESRRIVTLMQTLRFGYIESLHVRQGQPVFEPFPRVVRELKLGSEIAPSRCLDCADFAVKPQVLEFLEQCRLIGDGVIECLIVKWGMPFQMSVELKPSAIGG